MNREKVKLAAIDIVKQVGLINLSRRELCENVGIPDGSFPHIMGCNFANFVEELREEGIKNPDVPVSKSRANPSLRRDHILNVAIEMAKVKGYSKITRDEVADSAGVSTGLVTRYFGTMLQLKNKVVVHAIKNELLEIVAQCIVNHHPKAKSISSKLRAKAMASYSK